MVVPENSRACSANLQHSNAPHNEWDEGCRVQFTWISIGPQTNGVQAAGALPRGCGRSQTLPCWSLLTSHTVRDNRHGGAEGQHGKRYIFVKGTE